ncbi:Type 1 phosphatases regulator ypi1 [Coemansia sp. RSA 1200]|nr:Type 1 phosphatases regulator ypi1 [Coemansia sp. RSA 1200]
MPTAAENTSSSSSSNNHRRTPLGGTNIHAFQPTNSEAFLRPLAPHLHDDTSSAMLSPLSARYAVGIAGHMMTRTRDSASSTPTHGSRTMVITPSEIGEGDEEGAATPQVGAGSSSSRGGVLFLRGNTSTPMQGAREPSQPQSNGPRVRWTDDTIDNENMNRKKSKVCCIYRKERQFGESDSDESDDSSSCGSDSDGDNSPNEYERMPRYGVPKKQHQHSHRARSHFH